MSGLINVTGAKSGIIGTTAKKVTDGLSHVSSFRLDTQFTTNATAITGWSQGQPLAGNIGAQVTESSGVFTVPVTGTWFCIAMLYTWNAVTDNWMEIRLMRNANNLAHGIHGSYGSHLKAGTVTIQATWDVDAPAGDAVTLVTSSLAAGSYVQGTTPDVYSNVTFMRLGDKE